MLHLGPAAALWIDADVFEQAVVLYRGPLLDGGDEDSWAGSDRIQLEQRYRGALRSLAQGQAQAAIVTLQRLVRSDLTDEACQRTSLSAMPESEIFTRQDHGAALAVLLFQLR